MRWCPFLSLIPKRGTSQLCVLFCVFPQIAESHKVLTSKEGVVVQRNRPGRGLPVLVRVLRLFGAVVRVPVRVLFRVPFWILVLWVVKSPRLFGVYAGVACFFLFAHVAGPFESREPKQQVNLSSEVAGN